MLREYYKAARNAAAVVEKDWYGIIKLTGSERLSWLQGMVTNDVEKLAAGQGCYAAHLSPQGRMIAQMIVLRDEDCLRLVLERATVTSLVSAFDKLLIMEDVQIVDESDTTEIIGVIGPGAKGALESWFGEPLELNEVYAHRGMGDTKVSRTDLGYDVFVSRELADKVLRGLAQSGATAIDHGTWDVLRTEAGLPIYGVDIDETTVMPELGERGISYEKGCYVGQEVVAKVKYIGHVNRRFVGLVIEGEIPAEMKSTIRKDNKDVGYVTTSLFSPGMGKPIALGFVSRPAFASGTAVEIVSHGKVLAARIEEFPKVQESAAFNHGV
jgi:folate-binding protein YgfZ